MNELEAELRRTLSSREPPISVDERFRQRALKEGLVDVAYSVFPSPIGRLLAAVTKRGLVRLAYIDGNADAVLRLLAQDVSPRLLELPAKTASVREELQQYFARERERFGISIDLSHVPGFSMRVLEATADIPYGQVLTYREVARRAGREAAVRAAGNALARNPIPIVVPCHRVVRTGGGLGGYTGGLDRKRRLLALEGVPAA